MDITMIVLRLFHIIAGVFWVGAALLVFFVILPFTQSTGEEGRRFLQRLLSQSRYSVYMTWAALLNVISGVLMYWFTSNGVRLTWLVSPGGMVLTIGALVGIGAFLIGMLVHGPTSNRLASLGKEIAAGGAPPTPAQAQELTALQARIARASVWSMIFMIISVIGMAVARYV
jgi:uncharacterized membrane protein